MQLLTERTKIFWNQWEIRMVVLLSLLLQVILIVFGNRRKITVRSWIQILVWSAYMMADWVATVALGNLARNLLQGDKDDGSPETNNALQSFWAPFLLLHLGGPDTITAYSLEDNELWLRHFLGFIVQVGVAFYVFVQSWSNTALTFIAIPMFISGIIKYGERTLALRASSTENFKDTLPSRPDTCQDLIVINSEELEDPSKAIVPKEGINLKDRYLVQAYFLFKRFEFLFAAGRTLPTDDWNERFSIVRYMEARDAFKLIEVELGFLYDVLYTKANIAYSRSGILLRCICFICSLSTLIVFSATIDIHAFRRPDVSITFLLLIGAVMLEAYAFFVLFFSSWTKIWLIRHESKEGNSISTTDQLVNSFWRFTSHCHSFGFNEKWWSGSMGQFNMINFCLKEAQRTCIGVTKLPYVGTFLENYMYLTREDVAPDLQEKIFNHLKRKYEEFERLQESRPYIQARDEVLAERGGYAIQINDYFYDEKNYIGWSIVDVEFDTSLLLWHIATDLCYYHYLNVILSGDYDKLGLNCKISKWLSDYILYLQLFRTSMVPESVEEVRYKGTCNATIEFFKKMREGSDKSTFDGRSALLREELPNPANDTMSLLCDASGLAKNILSAASNQSFEEMWGTVSEVWVEMLVYAASNCGWKEHAQPLVKGGELLTHVCLLMTHFGLTKQYVRRYYVQTR